MALLLLVFSVQCAINIYHIAGMIEERDIKAIPLLLTLPLALFLIGILSTTWSIELGFVIIYLTALYVGRSLYREPGFSWDDTYVGLFSVNFVLMHLALIGRVIHAFI